MPVISSVLATCVPVAASAGVASYTSHTVQICSANSTGLSAGGFIGQFARRPGTHRPICRFWFFTRQRHDLHKLLEGEGGWRSWALRIRQKDFDGLTQQFWLSYRFDGLQTELSRSFLSV